MIENQILDSLIDQIVEFAERAEKENEEIQHWYRTIEDALKELRARRFGWALDI